MTVLADVRSGHWLLGGLAQHPALVDGDLVVTYAELRDRVARRRATLGVRSLVVLEARPTVDFVVDYLAALAEEHPVLLVEEGATERQGDLLAEYPPGTVEGLHPDLALLLSTSGSTGSPKLVRLSRTNLLSNARSIADYLGLGPSDVAPTTLPLHYCYGLSVLHSHLLVGGTVVLTDLSVADACFWDLAERTAVTGIAGVPHTFALLDAVEFGSRVLPRLPALRRLTQAGGRMAPERVRAYARLLREHGSALVVMYGQTEATARIAYLPPDLVLENADTIGVPVPGGSLRIEPVPGAPHGAGELVYTGPNVMMGYARSRADLARGAELSELRTGDLARLTDAGLWQVLGRIDRQAKVLGHRIDLDRAEARVADAGDVVRLVARPDRLWVFTTDARARSRVRAAVDAATGLRGTAVKVVVLDVLPATSSGKPDDAALRLHVDREDALSAPSPDGPPTPEEVRDLYAVALARPDATVDDSFVGLGGDSLSYVEVATRLGQRLGRLPTSWPRLSAAELAATGTGTPPEAPASGGSASGATVPRRARVDVDTTVLLRAAAITLVVVTHADLVQLQGGAHVLLALVGYNLVRFQLAVPGRRRRARALLRSAGAVAVPTVLFVGLLATLGHRYEWPTALLLNGLVGEQGWDDQWQFWFLEVVVWTYVALAALVLLPGVARALDRAPFACALVALGVTLGLRYAWTGIAAESTERYTTGVVLWCVALGACAAAAATWRQRLLVAAVAVVATVGFFGEPRREGIVVVGVLLLLVVRSVRVPAPVAAAAGALATASLWIYLTHWQVYPPLEDAGYQVAAIVASLAVGLAASFAWDAARRWARTGAAGKPPQISSGTIVIAPAGHSAAQMPQPLQ